MVSLNPCLAASCGCQQRIKTDAIRTCPLMQQKPSESTARDRLMTERERQHPGERLSAEKQRRRNVDVGRYYTVPRGEEVAGGNALQSSK